MGRNEQADDEESKHVELFEMVRKISMPSPPPFNSNRIAKMYTELTAKTDLDETGMWVEELEKMLEASQ